ncbi:MAG: DUF6263 family protein [Planctomycetota bacterium]|nr:DUF6263 family protein [Planctomycetota bacterium]
MTACVRRLIRTGSSSLAQCGRAVASRRSFLTLALFVLVAAIPAQAFAQAVDLRPKFTRDVRLQISLDDSTTSDEQTDIKTVSKQDVIVLLKPKGTEGGRDGVVTVVDFVFERIVLARDDGEGMSKFDSNAQPKTETERSLHAALKPLIGATMEVRFDETGAVQSVSAVDSINPDGPLASVSSSFMDSMGLGRLLGPIMTLSPPKGKASPGERWQVKSQAGSGDFGTLKFQTDYQLTNVKDGKAEVSFQGTITSDAEGTTGASVTSFKNSRQSGSYSWNVEEGMIQKMESSMLVVFENTFTDATGKTHKSTLRRATKMRVTRPGA